MNTYKITRYRLITEVKIYEVDDPDNALNMAKSSVDEWDEERDQVWRYKTEQLCGPK